MLDLSVVIKKVPRGEYPCPRVTFLHIHYLVFSLHVQAGGRKSAWSDKTCSAQNVQRDWSKSSSADGFASAISDSVYWIRSDSTASR